MSHRFYLPDAGAARDYVLPDDEGAHLTRVLRLGVGEAIRVFDGRGGEWDATVIEAGRRQVTVRVGNPALPRPEARVALRLAVAVLKADKMDAVVRDATMLGVTTITPLITARTEHSRDALARGARQERWQRIALASVKQCGRAVVPVVEDTIDVERYLATPITGVRIVLVEPAAVTDDVRRPRDLPTIAAADLVSGPEGGWTADELDQARRHSSILMTLGALTLRADAVPIVAVSALRALWADL